LHLISIKRERCIYIRKYTLKNAKLLVVEGTIYPTDTIKNDGLLNYRWEESTSGPPRKYYGLLK
jgi:PadR family transcriptional regulator PadR